ncbi:hypothetical protein EDC01DRAFT_645409 [Geopyxis carbonaria]|nr:hypothetical protein EDC01DRAFT_645409 [Geopyxis carbonaria]
MSYMITAPENNFDRLPVELVSNIGNRLPCRPLAAFVRTDHRVHAILNQSLQDMRSLRNQAWHDPDMILNAVRTSNYALTAHLLAAGVPPKYSLFIAINHGDLDLVRLLVDSGSDIDLTENPYWHHEANKDLCNKYVDWDWGRSAVFNALRYTTFLDEARGLEMLEILSAAGAQIVIGNLIKGLGFDWRTRPGKRVTKIMEKMLQECGGNWLTAMKNTTFWRGSSSHARSRSANPGSIPPYFTFVVDPPSYRLPI